jgi:menaquinone-dependent protoporphyrinogen oxidase
MRVLVTWGSKMGGTAGIAEILGDELSRDGLEVSLRPAREVRDLRPYDAVLVGGALYANRWHGDARHFVARHEAALQKVPVWFFSSGPLDDSAGRGRIPPPTQVAVLMERVGALGHVTFGGRLEPDARGSPARAMAKQHAGDWRDPARVRAWATELAMLLPTAEPGPIVIQPARAWPRLIAHGTAGWAGCGVAMGGLLAVTRVGVAVALHAIAAPLIFAAVAWHYFRARGARDPLPTAAAFTGVVMLLDLLVVAGLIEHRLSLFASIAGAWLPFALIFLTSWAVGGVMSTLPWPKPEARHDTRHPGSGAAAAGARH